MKWLEYITRMYMNSCALNVFKNLTNHLWQRITISCIWPVALYIPINRDSNQKRMKKKTDFFRCGIVARCEDWVGQKKRSILKDAGKNNNWKIYKTDILAWDNLGHGVCYWKYWGSDSKQKENKDFQKTHKDIEIVTYPKLKRIAESRRQWRNKIRWLQS